MSNQRNTIFGAITRIICVVLFFMPFFDSNEVSANNESVQFAEKVNLALRRTAHNLLIVNGDSVSRIPAVGQMDANTFNVKIDHLFNYDKLPQLLQESLDLHGIKRPYNVSILNCNNGQIQLGYNFQDLSKKGGVPCAKRSQEPGCYNLKVSFYPESKTASTGSNWWVLPIGSLLVGLGFIVWKRAKKEQIPVSTQQIEVAGNSTKSRFGTSELDLPNLLLLSGNKTYNLTYREAKLLNLFTLNKNQILERDFILKSVWEDEGIIVGRSVDVFVSRLRKMLANDANIKIAAVHGIGYRMEITP